MLRPGVKPFIVERSSNLGPDGPPVAVRSSQAASESEKIGEIFNKNTANGFLPRGGVFIIIPKSIYSV